MKTLLDTSFLRHLEQINLFRLLIDFSDILRYEFVMPETVYNELDAKNIPPEVRELLEKGIIEFMINRLEEKFPKKYWHYIWGG